MHDVKLLRDQTIGLETVGGKAHHHRPDRDDCSSDDEHDENGDDRFIDKFLDANRITIFGTSSHFLEETTRSCEQVRKLLANQPLLEYDLGLKEHVAVKEALKRQLRGTYELPQVFFGKDWIGGLRVLQEDQAAGTLQSLIDQFIKSNREWTEIPFEQLKFGAKLGAGASGTVRVAKWHGNDYAVKIFNPGDVNDFHDEMSILEKLRHPNIVAFYGACVDHSSHMCIVQELCASSVYDHLQKFGKLQDAKGEYKLGLLTRIRYAYDAAKGVRQCLSLTFRCLLSASLFPAS